MIRKLRYENYSRLCDACTWRGLDLTLLEPDLARINGPGFFVVVRIPLVDPEEGGEIATICGRFGADDMRALGLRRETWGETFKRLWEGLTR